MFPFTNKLLLISTGLLVAEGSKHYNTTIGKDHSTPNDFPRRARYKASLVTTEKSKLCASCTFNTPEGAFHEIDANRGIGKIIWEFTKNGTKISDLNVLFDTIGSSEKDENLHEMLFLIHKNGNITTSTSEIGEQHHDAYLDEYRRNKKISILSQQLDIGIESTLIQSNDFCQTVPLPANPSNRASRIFNETWNYDAKYTGLTWFNGQFTRRYENVFPFFIQGERYVSVYYEDVYSGLPYAYENVVATTFFHDWEVCDLMRPDDCDLHHIATDFFNVKDACDESTTSGTSSGIRKDEEKTGTLRTSNEKVLYI